MGYTMYMETIRLETPADFRAVEELTRRAFWNVYVPGCDEHYMVHTMRNNPDFVKELALVSELDGKIVANVMYTKALLVDENGNKQQVLSFGPISVEPSLQRQGFGKRLLEHSFELAKKLGFTVIVIFGNPGNYTARGFRNCTRFNISYETLGNFPCALLVLELVPHTLDGRKYLFKESSACCIDATEAAAFDATFPVWEKQTDTPSQEEFYIYSHSSLTR